MSTALYVVIFSRGSWWVDLEGTPHGPYATRDAAASEARQLAGHAQRRSEVLVPDETGRHRVTWSNGASRRMPRDAHRPSSVVVSYSG